MLVWLFEEEATAKVASYAAIIFTHVTLFMFGFCGCGELGIYIDEPLVTFWAVQMPCVPVEYDVR